MSILFKSVDIVPIYESAIYDKGVNTYKTTPFITTFSETVITEFDIHSFIELGLKVVRFKMTNVTKSEKLLLLELLHRAVKWYCEKYDVSAWPIALSIDVPNACIKTGFLENEGTACIRENSIVEITTDVNYWTKCDEHLIFIDDPYSLPYVKLGTEISIDFGSIVMICTKIINETKIECKVERGGKIFDLAFVCIRGIRHAKPALTKRDIEIIEFAKEFKFDIITINSVRTAKTVYRVKEMFPDPETRPIVMSTICEQEGLDNLDSIITASDGIILAREFIAHEIIDKYKMISIQLYANAKCKVVLLGKPFYLSGDILAGQLLNGKLTGCDLNDITNAVLQRAGFVMRNFKDPANLVKAMQTLQDICTTIEPLTRCDRQFWRMAMEYKMPTTAAEAAVLATILLAKVTNAIVIIVPTVTGRTVRQVAHMSADNIIIAITSNARIAKQLQIHKGVISIFYDKKQLKIWNEEIDTRVKFAVAYAIKFEVLNRGDNYVVLRKSLPTSSYCDLTSSCQALNEEDIIRLECNRKKTLQNIENKYVTYLSKTE